MGKNRRENERLGQKANTKKVINTIAIIAIIISLVVISVILNNRKQNTNASGDNYNNEFNLTKAEIELENKFLNSDKPVLVDYYADWCQPCVMMAPIIQELELGQEDFYVYKVDVDKHNNLANKAGVYTIPCFVLYNNGEFVKSTVGVQSKDNLIKFVKDNTK